MHALIRGLVALRLSRPDAEEAFVRHDVDVQTLKDLLDEAAALNASHREAITLGSAGKLSPLAVAGIEAGLIPKIKKAEAKIKALRITPLAATLVRPTPEEVAAAWDDLTVHQQREMVRALFTSIVVHPLGRGTWQRGTLLTGIDLAWRRSPNGASIESSLEQAAHPTVGESASEVERVVPALGRICVAGTRLSLGKEHAGETVVARFDDVRLIVYSADGGFLASAERAAT